MRHGIGIVVVSLLLATWAWAEQIEFSTYYPTGGAGSSAQITGDSAAIGATFKNQTPPTNGLIVEGNVGIGTTSPQAPLEIAGSRGFLFLSGTDNTANASTADLNFIKAPNGFNWHQTLRGVSGNLEWHGRPSMPITGPLAAPAVVPLALTLAGNVGIGTSSPQTKLHVETPGNAIIRAVGTGPGGSGQAFLQLTSAGNRAWEAACRSNGNFAISDLSANQQRIVITPAGNVGIQNLSPQHPLHVSGRVCAANISCPSDYRLKANPQSLSGVLPKLNKIHGVSFEWNELSKAQGFVPGKKDLGLVAQEVEAVFPELVTTDLTPEGYKSIDYSRLSAVLVEAIKEQQKMMELLKSENAALSGRIAALEEIETASLGDTSL